MKMGEANLKAFGYRVATLINIASKLLAMPKWFTSRTPPIQMGNHFRAKTWKHTGSKHLFRYNHKLKRWEYEI